MSVSQPVLSVLRKDTSGGVPRRSRQPTDKAVVDSVARKLEKLSRFTNLRRFEKHDLAMKLSSTEEMTGYFSDYIEERRPFEVISEVLEDMPSENDDTTGPPRAEAEAPANSTDDAQTDDAQTDDAQIEDLVRDLSDFSVGIHITSRDNHPKLSLQVKQQVVEWTSESLIIPHQDIPDQTLLTIDLSQCLRETLVAREARPAHAEYPAVKNDLLSKLVSARKVLIEHIVKQIVIFNRYYGYKLDVRDSQSFINNLLSALNVDSLPPLSRALALHLSKLTNQEELLSTKDHKELDEYVLERAANIDTGMAEYLALMYFRCHLEMRAKSDDPGCMAWHCPNPKCQLRALLLKLNK